MQRKYAHVIGKHSGFGVGNSAGYRWAYHQQQGSPLHRYSQDRAEEQGIERDSKQKHSVITICKGGDSGGFTAKRTELMRCDRNGREKYSRAGQRYKLESTAGRGCFDPCTGGFSIKRGGADGNAGFCKKSIGND